MWPLIYAGKRKAKGVKAKKSKDAQKSATEVNSRYFAYKRRPSTASKSWPGQDVSCEYIPSAAVMLSC